MTNVLPEIPVKDADPATREIYERIMSATGVGSPALIYRHFAVYPGMLGWVWDIVGAPLESGYAAGHALDAVATTPVVSLAAVHTDEMRADGISAEAHRTIDAMLATYNRMNPVNLSLIMAIRDLIASDEKSGTPPAPLPPVTAPPPATALKLPAPLDLDAMPDDVRRAVLELSAAIPSPGAQVIPTLYRHLAIWPDFLLRVAPGLADAMQRGEVEARMRDLSAAMQPLIDNVTYEARAGNPPPPPISDPAAMIETLNSFLYTIPQLVVVGTALRTAIPICED